MNNFKIESENKKINVNGVDLVFNFDDNEFTKKLLNLKSILDKNKSQNNSIDSFVEELANYFNDLFGENTCKDIFGVVYPSFRLIFKLVEIIMPYLNDFLDERTLKISEKYNYEREGNV